MNKYFFSFIALVLVFTSCRILMKSGRVITDKEYVGMVEGPLASVGDVIKLLPVSVADIEKRLSVFIASLIDETVQQGLYEFFERSEEGGSKQNCQNSQHQDIHFIFVKVG